MKFTRPGSGRNIKDVRGQGGSGGGLGGFPIPAGKGGAGLIGILVVVAVLLLGGNLMGGEGNGGIGGALNDIDATAPPSGADGAPDPDAKLKEFVSQVLDDNQQFWAQQFSASGKEYDEAQLVLFNRPISTGGCGGASPATGPFYCPADRSVYLDFGFFNELRTRFGAPGDFAQAYVLAHELGHHVQNILGIEAAMRKEQRADPSRRNELSVRLELQADCLAGVWAHSTYERGVLEAGDIAEGLAAAAAVGDDRLGARSPEQWTHGSSALRVKWFQRGYQSGSTGSCDTFSGEV